MYRLLPKFCPLKGYACAEKPFEHGDKPAHPFVCSIHSNMCV